jgi:hypothetical protein
MTHSQAPGALHATSASSSRRRVWIGIAIVAAVFGICIRIFCGLYSIQPIGGLPEGRTALVWRADGEPFFNSADARCLERLGGVSLFCRATALSVAPTARIILRLPYQHWAYLASTGGKEFGR